MEQHVTVDIEAPPERVWQVMTDVEHWPDWTASVRWVRRLDEGPLRPGSSAKISQPRIPTSDWVVTELDPGRSFTWVMRGPAILTQARHVVDRLPGGGSRVTLSIEPHGWLGELFGRAYRGTTDRYLAMEAAGLKSQSEGTLAR